MFRLDVGGDGSKADELTAKLQDLANRGIQTVIGGVPHAEEITPLEVIGDRVIPKVAKF
jgi:alkanesulfonate monooxygenase